MQEKTENFLYFSRVEKLKISKGWTWDEIAKRLQLTRGMLHFIKKEKYAVSKRNIFMLEKLEREEGVAGSRAKEIIAEVDSNVEQSKIPITPADFDRGYLDAPVKYARGEPPIGYPGKIRLVRPDSKTMANIIVARKLDEDPEQVLFACIADKNHKTREFLNLLTPFSLLALMDAAERFSFGAHWKKR